MRNRWTVAALAAAAVAAGVTVAPVARAEEGRGDIRIVKTVVDNGDNVIVGVLPEEQCDDLGLHGQDAGGALK